MESNKTSTKEAHQCNINSLRAHVHTFSCVATVAAATAPAYRAHQAASAPLSDQPARICWHTLRCIDTRPGHHPPVRSPSGARPAEVGVQPLNIICCAAKKCSRCTIAPRAIGCKSLFGPICVAQTEATAALKACGCKSVMIGNIYFSCAFLCNKGSFCTPSSLILMTFEIVAERQQISQILFYIILNRHFYFTIHLKRSFAT